MSYCTYRRKGDEAYARTVFLDRDGVINVPPTENWILHPEQLFILPGAVEAIRKLNVTKTRVVIITNQSCVGRGHLPMEKLEQIHLKMQDLLAVQEAYVDAIYVCPDYPPVTGPSRHRKPEPGMLLDALQDYHLHAPDVPFVGDTVTDVQAAMGAGCPPHLVLTGHGERDREKAMAIAPHLICHASLAAAVDVLLSHTS